MTFYGRERELKQFQNFLNRNDVNLAVVFGRRRIGKSELIKEAIRRSGLRSIYLECRQTSEAEHVELLAELGARLLGLPGLAADKLERVLDLLAQHAESEPLIVVLDEYPYLRDLVKGCDSILQAYVDRWKGKSRIKLILCGSYIDVMKGVLEYKSPLYGRAAVALKLEPMDYFEASLFYPNATLDDKVRFFSIFGGVPYYNALIDPMLSVRENILKLLSFKAFFLTNEVDMFLRSELAKINNANLVLTAVALGAKKFSDILAQTRIEKSPTLADTLERLTGMGILTKTAPINDEGNKRRMQYRIADPLVDFYFRYVFRNASMLQVMTEADFYESFVAVDFEEQFVPKAFEEICRQYLIRRNKAGLNQPAFFRIGRYYYDLPRERRNGEFDIVTEDALGYVFYEAKFRSHPMTKRQIEEEIAQVKASPLATERFGFFSRSGFAEEAGSSDIIRLFTLADIYADLMGTGV